jgi:capsular exopolysaccharide synthesis family protein
MDRSVHTRADVLVATGLPVLGLIPRIPRAGRRLALIADLARGGRASARGIRAAQPPRPPSSAPQETYSFLGAGSGEITPDYSSDAVQPVYPGIPTLSRGVSRATIQGIGTAVTEAYSSLQTNIMYSRGKEPVRTLVFTSALPGEGKTTNAVNLALTLAQRGIRVLIVDADLRRGVVHHLLDVPRQPGLTEVLAGAIPLSAALHTVQVEEGGPLRILTTGAVPANPVATLESQEMARLLTHLREQFEVVILDAPPVNIITDAAILGASTDGVVIVARAGFTETGALEYAMHQLGLVHATALGVILNGIDFRRDAAYDSTYRYYQYSYKSGEKK